MMTAIAIAAFVKHFVAVEFLVAGLFFGGAAAVLLRKQYETEFFYTGGLALLCFMVAVMLV